MSFITELTQIFILLKIDNIAGPIFQLVKVRLHLSVLFVFVLPVAHNSKQNGEQIFMYKISKPNHFQTVPDGSYGTYEKSSEAVQEEQQSEIWPTWTHEPQVWSVCTIFYWGRKSFCFFKKQNPLLLPRAKDILPRQIKTLCPCSKQWWASRNQFISIFYKHYYTNKI